MWKGLLAVAALSSVMLVGCNTNDRNAMNYESPAKEIRRGVDDMIDNNHTPRYNNDVYNAPNGTAPPATRSTEPNRMAPNDGTNNNGRVIERDNDDNAIIEDRTNTRNGGTPSNR